MPLQMVVNLIAYAGDQFKSNENAVVIHLEHIWHILNGIGWPIAIPEFDLPTENHSDNISQLVSHTHDGFAEPEMQLHYDEDYATGPDPPAIVLIDSPHWDD